MKKTQMIKITCQFQYARLTVEIPRLLFYNYWVVWGSLENSLKIERARIEMSSMKNPPELRRKFYLRNKDRFNKHQEIFSSVYLNHVTRSNEEVEYYIQFALDHWLNEMEANRPEPSEYLVTEIRRARESPKVQVLNYVNRMELE